MRIFSRRTSKALLRAGLACLPLLCLPPLAHADTLPEPAPTEAQATSSSAATPSRADLEARMERLKGTLEQLRGLKFKSPVALEIQSLDQFRAYVSTELDRELPPEELKRQEKVLKVFGMVPESFDLRQGLIDLMVSQAGAYYRPDNDTFYLLMADLPTDAQDTIILHELQHALQDQYFDLDALKKQVNATGNDDARQALTFLVEGEASYLMLVQQLEQQGVTVSRLPPDQQVAALSKLANQDPRTIAKLAVKQAPSPSMKRVMEGINTLPTALLASLFDPYFKGQLATGYTRAYHGWAAVDTLFKQLPTSSEQLLHPEKLQAPRDEPDAVQVPELVSRMGKGWKEVARNTMGEASIQQFFGSLRLSDARDLAAGWDGDQYVLLEGPDGASVLVWWTVWDTAEDAEAFVNAMASVDVPTLGTPSGPRRRELKRVEQVVRVVVGTDEHIRQVQSRPAPKRR